MWPTKTLVYVLILLTEHYKSCFAIGGDRLSKGQFLSKSETIISEKDTFELGFFSPPGSSHRIYLGIWYKSFTERTTVWIANREKPVLSTSSAPTFGISQDGNLVLMSDKDIIWSTKLNLPSTNSLESVLLESGNFVLRDISKSSDILWQSFDLPTDTWLPGAKLGYNKLTGKSRYLMSWKNPADPSSGLYSVQLDPDASSIQYILQWNMSKTYSTSGHFNSGTFRSFPEFSYTSQFSFTSNEKESYFTYFSFNSETLLRIVINPSGELKQLAYRRGVQGWTTIFTQPRSKTDIFAHCGAFGIFRANFSPPCTCLPGFTSFPTDDTRLADWPFSCVRKTPLQCKNISNSEKGETDGYLNIPDLKLPAFSSVLATRGAKECESECSRTCSCTAYSYDGSECSLWDGAILDLQQLQSGDVNVQKLYAQKLYVKVASSELPKKSGDKEKLKFIISSVVSAAVILMGGSMGYRCTKKIKEKGNKATGEDLLSFDFDCSSSTQNDQTKEINYVKSGGRKDYDLPSFSYESVSAATNNFSADNKLGEGGFGPVYKGKSLSGHEIAVKRLSKGSKQGIEEFRNEIALIAKLQHRNLVRLLGCCFERDENILIYEFMANKSLDTYLFDSNKKGMLEWRIRVSIIEGIAQGLLYLHEYSRIHIIHRDLKAGNILLDCEMNPKISDFGMARIFGGKDSQTNTDRVVGTYGYMAPEYALQGIFSIKSDVFSFGVLLLEIVSGKKNTGFYQTDSLNLLGYAWELWTCNRAEELKDSAIGCVQVSELLRYINIGLLCVQEDPNVRPTMSKIASMLNNELATLPQPNQPAFSISRIGRTDNQPSTSAGNCSVNGLTVSMIQPR